MTAPGKLRRLFSLQRSVVSSGQSGWVKVARIWGNLQPVKTDAAVVATNFDRRLTHRIAIRYRRDVETGMRLVRGDAAFTIRGAVDRDDRNRFLDLWVEINDAS